MHQDRRAQTVVTLAGPAQGEAGAQILDEAQHQRQGAVQPDVADDMGGGEKAAGDDVGQGDAPLRQTREDPAPEETFLRQRRGEDDGDGHQEGGFVDHGVDALVVDIAEIRLDVQDHHGHRQIQQPVQAQTLQSRQHRPAPPARPVPDRPAQQLPEDDQRQYGVEKKADQIDGRLGPDPRRYADPRHRVGQHQHLQQQIDPAQDLFPVR